MLVYVILASASSEGSDDPVHTYSLARVFIARTHKNRDVDESSRENLDFKSHKINVHAGLYSRSLIEIIVRNEKIIF